MNLQVERKRSPRISAKRDCVRYFHHGASVQTFILKSIAGKFQSNAVSSLEGVGEKHKMLPQELYIFIAGNKFASPLP
jgi:hypothetical protein